MGRQRDPWNRPRAKRNATWAGIGAALLAGGVATVILMVVLNWPDPVPGDAVVKAFLIGAPVLGFLSPVGWIAGAAVGVPIYNRLGAREHAERVQMWEEERAEWERRQAEKNGESGRGPVQ